MHYATIDHDLSDTTKYERWLDEQVESCKKAFTKAFGICYISGPMSGLPDLNYPAFFAAEEELKDKFNSILNPARLELDVDQSSTWENWMRKAIVMLTSASHVVLLPGWENSKGAKLELAIAEALNLTIIEIK